MSEEPLEGEVVDREELDDLDDHALTVTRTVYGKVAQCRCYRWDGWWNGPASERAVREEHARHVEAMRTAGA